MLEKAAAIKRFEYCLLGKDLSVKQASVAKKQYKKLDNAFESNKKEEDKTKSKRSSAKSNLVYNKYLYFTNITTLKNLLNVLLIKTK